MVSKGVAEIFGFRGPEVLRGVPGVLLGVPRVFQETCDSWWGSRDL